MQNGLLGQDVGHGAALGNCDPGEKFVQLVIVAGFGRGAISLVFFSENGIFMDEILKKCSFRKVPITDASFGYISSSIYLRVDLTTDMGISSISIPEERQAFSSSASIRTSPVVIVVSAGYNAQNKDQSTRAIHLICQQFMERQPSPAIV